MKNIGDQIYNTLLGPAPVSAPYDFTAIKTCFQPKPPTDDDLKLTAMLHMNRPLPPRSIKQLAERIAVDEGIENRLKDPQDTLWAIAAEVFTSTDREIVYDTHSIHP